MRLTTDLILQSTDYINPLAERELDLRGHKVPAIENLGAAKGQEAIDLTDNDIAILGNFPLSPHLTTLLLARNRISNIQPTLSRSIPNLTNLSLTQNRISNLADLEPLVALKKLKHLSLLDNPITSKENYRYYVIWRLPSLYCLDFARVRQPERERAKGLFGTPEQPTELALQIIKAKSTTSASQFNDLDTEKSTTHIKLKKKEEKRFKELIRNAKSLAEIAKLEKDFAEGRIPGRAEGSDEDEDMHEG